MAFTFQGDERVVVKISKVEGGIASDPPVGYCFVTNLYVDPETGKLIVEYDDEEVT